MVDYNRMGKNKLIVRNKVNNKVFSSKNMHVDNPLSEYTKLSNEINLL